MKINQQSKTRRSTRAGITLISTMVALIVVAGLAVAVQRLSFENTRVLHALIGEVSSSQIQFAATELSRPHVAQLLSSDENDETKIVYVFDGSEVKTLITRAGRRSFEITHKISN